MPDDEEEDDPIPEGLKKKWSEAEAKGRRAGVCGDCGNLYSDDDLFCRHCESRTRIPGGFMGRFGEFLLDNIWGLCIMILFLIALFTSLVMI